jgi:glutamine cyclotransferase
MHVLRISSFILVGMMILIFSACEKKDSESTLATKPLSTQTALKQFIAHSAAPLYSFTVIKAYPHDPEKFTEGLVLDNGFLYESAGLYQRSTLQKKAFNTLQLLQTITLPPQYFAEGITIIGNYLYQLTYKEHTGFVYDKNTLKLKKIFYYLTEGWGLTTDGKELIMSNGSAELLFINPTSFNVTHTLHITDQKQPIYSLNALQYIRGNIYANIWPTDIIAIISAKNGKVIGWINLESLNTPANCAVTACATNGIAYHEQDKTLLVTGKNWFHLYAISVLSGIKAL